MEEVQNDPEYPSSRSLRLVRMLPPALVAEPERVVLNFAFILIGIGAYFSNDAGSVVSHWPIWVLVYWGLSMVIGGTSVLYGLFRGDTTVERLGYLLVGPACLIYAVTVAFVRGLPGTPVAIVFLALAVTKAIRMVISSAQRDQTIEYGERLDREEGPEET